MSSAGDKSMANEGGLLVLSGMAVEGLEWREIVKENSWEGEEEDEGGEAVRDGTAADCCFAAWSSSTSSCSPTFSLVIFCCCCWISIS